MPRKRKKTLVLAIRDAFSYIALWQVLSFMILLLLVWVNEYLDIAHLFWGVAKQPPDLLRGCLASAGVLFGLIVTVGHTYLQQRTIVSGMLTICSYCHRIRIDDEIWQQIEQYVSRNSSIMLSHGICPDCYEKAVESMDEHPQANDESHPASH